MQFDPADEWHDWFRLSPLERWHESMKLWPQYLAQGGSLDPEPDSQSPFDFPELRGARPVDGRTGLRILRQLALEFPDEAKALAAATRPLLKTALQNDVPALDEALAAEERAERAADRAYWIPLKADLERMRHA
jgi:hypothetical protein